MNSSLNDTLVNKTLKYRWLYDTGLDDASWIMTSAFMIFTMQTGFGLLESGAVSVKNEVNIMMKNVVDIVLGGLTYWMFGFGLSFGRGEYSNQYFGYGDFFFNPSKDDPDIGAKMVGFIFQLSFATTSTTIVSGAMAERCDFKAYCLFSLLNNLVYCLPASWTWNDEGFLNQLGVVDIAGSGPVHLVGGSSALACVYMLGPRLGRYMNGTASLPLGCPVNAVLGLFVLWWGWLAFNSGSTYGITEERWSFAARAAVNTMLSSFGGGCYGILHSIWFYPTKYYDLAVIINAILGSLVAVTAGCFLYTCTDAILIGLIGAVITCTSMPWMDKCGLDDPVGAVPVHGFSGVWGVLAVGLFAENPVPLDTTNDRVGLFKGGDSYLLQVQAFACVCYIVWSITVTLILLWLVNLIFPIRMEPQFELIGADLVEHNIKHKSIGVTRAVSALNPLIQDMNLKVVQGIGSNPGHEAYIEKFYTYHKNPDTYKLKHLSLDGKDVLFQTNIIELDPSAGRFDNLGNVDDLLFPEKKEKRRKRNVMDRGLPMYQTNMIPRVAPVKKAKGNGWRNGSGREVVVKSLGSRGHDRDNFNSEELYRRFQWNE